LRQAIWFTRVTRAPPVGTPCENPRRVRDEGAFLVEQTTDPDGWVRLSLLGELDLVAAEGLVGQLNERKLAGDPVRLDLSRLQFIDSSGVRAILVTVRDARRDAWQIEVEHQLGSQVARVFDVLGVRAMVWPPDETAG
jgi:anti-anti-sigma factor